MFQKGGQRREKMDNAEALFKSPFFSSAAEELEAMEEFGMKRDGCYSMCKSPLRDEKRCRTDINFLLNGGALEKANADQLDDGILLSMVDDTDLLDGWNLPSFISEIEPKSHGELEKVEQQDNTPIQNTEHKSPSTTPRTVMAGLQNCEFGLDGIEFASVTLDLASDVLMPPDSPIDDGCGLLSQLNSASGGLGSEFPSLLPDCVDDICDTADVTNSVMHGIEDLVGVEMPPITESLLDIPPTTQPVTGESDTLSTGNASSTTNTKGGNDDSASVNWSTGRRGRVRDNGKKRSFPCPQCGFVFKMRSNLKRHIATVHEDRRSFVCDICQTSFGLKQNLVTHVRVKHERSRPFACDICGMTFGYKQVLQNHVRNIHSRRQS